MLKTHYDRKKNFKNSYLGHKVIGATKKNDSKKLRQHKNILDTIIKGIDDDIKEKKFIKYTKRTLKKAKFSLHNEDISTDEEIIIKNNKLDTNESLDGDDTSDSSVSEDSFSSTQLHVNVEKTEKPKNSAPLSRKERIERSILESKQLKHQKKKSLKAQKKLLEEINAVDIDLKRSVILKLNESGNNLSIFTKKKIFSFPTDNLSDNLDQFVNISKKSSKLAPSKNWNLLTEKNKKENKIKDLIDQATDDSYETSSNEN